MERFIMLAGPSCVGKGPLVRALANLYPEIAGNIKKVLLYNDRDPRVGEKDGKDYNFVREIQKLPDHEYIKMEIRPGNWQALKITDITQTMQSGRIGFLEIFHKLGAEAANHQALRDYFAKRDVCTVFLSPLSKDDIFFIKCKGSDLRAVVTDIMRRKLLRRTKKQKAILSLEDLKDIEKRCATAFYEMQSAYHYTWIIANHDGEDSDNWEQFQVPIGDALRSVKAFADICKGEQPLGCEQWSPEVL
jgi:guanylate kinase